MNLTKAKLFIAALLLTGLTGCRTNSLKDIDGNVYKTVTVGSQVWMASDLKTTRYNDGTPIPLVTDYDAWAVLSTPAYSWYNNEITNRESYGALYNYFAVNTNKLCPKGWHVPSDEEWTTLRTNLGGLLLAGGKLKEEGTVHWKSPNASATNESGFTALPGGFRSYNGSFNYMGISGYWWSSTTSSPSTVYFWNLRYKYGYVYKSVSNMTNGFCIRCMMDE
jgi:uncharacterized protein (TIGR02145 family)